MVGKRILVTGGAGFIGSHVVDALVDRGYDVTVFDNLEPQVHASDPKYLNERATYVVGDVRDASALYDVLRDVDVVYHQAAMVGVGQSMYQIERYVSVNTMGTALLLDLLANKEHTVRKLIVASSMSIYGEGAYQTRLGEIRFPRLRPDTQMECHEWDMRDEVTGEPLRPVGTPETKPLDSTSVYAISKKDQEEYCLAVGRAYGIPTVALRYFNVYGSRQSLNNPYTGVCAIFSSRIKNENRPVVYEDGYQTRDFVSVHDIVQANLLAMDKSGADYEAINVGTGRPTTILEVANTLAKLYGKPHLRPLVEQKYRAGDIRHCVADISRARKLLGYEPTVKLEDGLRELVEWGERETAVDRFEDVQRELTLRRLTKG